MSPVFLKILIWPIFTFLIVLLFFIIFRKPIEYVIRKRKVSLRTSKVDILIDEEQEQYEKAQSDINIRNYIKNLYITNHPSNLKEWLVSGDDPKTRIGNILNVSTSTTDVRTIAAASGTTVNASLDILEKDF